MPIQKWILLMSFGVLQGALLAQPSLHVDNSSPFLTINGTLERPYLSIGSAVCNSQPGNNIHIKGGNYQENLVLDKPITLLAENGPVVIQNNPALTAEIKFNEYFQKACHNCYEPKHAPSIHYALCSTNSIEIDIYDTRPGGRNQEWYVRHSFSGENNNCCSGNKNFSDCLRDVKRWSEAHPDHPVLTMFIDKKQDWGTGRMPSNLDFLIQSIFPLDQIFKPSDLLGSFSSLRAAANEGAWPTLRELQGKVIFVLTGGKLLNHNETQREYIESRGANAVFFITADADEVEDVLKAPDQFNSHTAPWVVFYNIKSGNEIIAPLIKSLGYISRVWGPGDWEESSQSYTRLVNDYVHYIALFEFEETRFNGGNMMGVKEIPITHHHHKRGSNCEHGRWATNDVLGHHHHRNGQACIHAHWATDVIQGHHHHKRGSDCIHEVWATDEQVNN